LFCPISAVVTYSSLRDKGPAHTSMLTSCKVNQETSTMLKSSSLRRQ